MPLSDAVGAGGGGDQTKDWLRTDSAKVWQSWALSLFRSGTEVVHVRSIEPVKGLMILGDWASESHRETKMPQDLG